MSCPWIVDLAVFNPRLPENYDHVAAPKVDTGSKIVIRARPIGWTYSILCCRFSSDAVVGCYTVASLITPTYCQLILLTVRGQVTLT